MLASNSSLSHTRTQSPHRRTSPEPRRTPVTQPGAGRSPDLVPDWGDGEPSEPDELDFLSLLTMTVALFGLGAFSLVSLLGIIVGVS